jgi:hypothetical protein
VLGVPNTWMLVVASSVAALAAAARSAMSSICNAIESASGGSGQTATSVPSSLAYSLNAVNCGWFASTQSTRPGTHFFSSASFPGLSRSGRDEEWAWHGASSGNGSARSVSCNVLVTFPHAGPGELVLAGRTRLYALLPARAVSSGLRARHIDSRAAVDHQRRRVYVRGLL